MPLFRRPSLAALERALFVVLVLMLGGGVWVVWLLPVSHYAVRCSRVGATRCALEQGRATRARTVIVPLPGADSATATVKILVPRRSGPRVLLYLQTPARSYFAAEFEGSDAGDSAFAAARRLNVFLTTPAAPPFELVVTPPALAHRLAWVGLAVMALLIALGYRARKHSAFSDAAA